MSDKKQGVKIQDTEQELLKMPRSKVIEDLTEKQQKFCEQYTRNNNARLSAKQAGYSPQSAHIIGWKIRQDYKCVRYIAWLKAKVADECCIKGAELIDQYIRIAFADITDFVTADMYGKIKIKALDQLDGQVITRISQSANGMHIELADKTKALDKLEKYFEFMPIDWRQKIEERKLSILEKRLELEKYKAGQFSEEDMDDGFIEALKESAEEAWAED